MRDGAHERRAWRWLAGAGALAASLALACAALAPGAAAQAQAQATVLARGRTDLPGEVPVFKLNEVPLPAGDPAVTQAHARGFDYTAGGTEGLTAGGLPHVTPPGQATRIGEQPVAAEDVVVQSPGDTRAFANAGPVPARLLVLSATPAGASPAKLPRTGAPAPVLPLVLAATAAGLRGVGLGFRHRVHPCAA